MILGGYPTKIVNISETTNGVKLQMVKTFLADPGETIISNLRSIPFVVPEIFALLAQRMGQNRKK